MNHLYIVDAVGYLFRAHHAITNMSNDQGQSTGALFGFIQSVLKLIKDNSPSHLVAVFDGPNNKASRLSIYPEYKAHRSACPPELIDQIQWAQQFCRLYGIPSLCASGVEADDTMGSVAKWAEQLGAQVYLCTSDKDMAQMVSERVFLLNVHSKDPAKMRVDCQGVKEIYGVNPEQVVDYLSIIGDASDNVPGLPGFGPKTAASLLQEHGTLEALLEHPELVPGAKKQQTLRELSHLAILSKKLVTLQLDVEFPAEEEFFALKSQQEERLSNFYQQMSFDSFLKEIRQKGRVQVVPQVSYRLVDSEEALQALEKELHGVKEICVDTETTDLHPLKAGLVGVGLAVKPESAWYIPLNGNLGGDRVLSFLKPLLEDPKRSFYGHNIKYDCHVLHSHGIQIAHVGFDTLLASYLLHSNERRHSLDHLALKHFNHVKIPTTDLIGSGKQQITMDLVPIDKVCAYCCEDVDYTVRLKLKLEEELKERGLTSLLVDLEVPLIRTLERMEWRGVHVDVPLLKELCNEVVHASCQVEKEIHELAEEVFNINSPKQLSTILFEKLNIPTQQKTSTGFSTNAEVLESLQEAHPIVGKVLEYRTLEKLRSTYLEALPEQVLPRSGRIHSTFSQTVAATGRLSSQDPNLQNIPVRTAIGKRVREAFTPSLPNWSFLGADYSQIELRILAHMSQDPTLVAAFLNGEDIHAATAAQIFHVPLKEVTPLQRDQAKAVNFGIIYGQQAFGLSQQLRIPRKEAEAFIQLYFQRFSRVKEFLEECKEQARQTGYATTLTGRQRQIPEIHSKNGALRAAAERLAINSPMQGSAADLIKLAMLAVEKALEQEKLSGYMLLQIHDELIIETPDEEISQLQPLVRRCMQDVWQLKVPLVVDLALGKNWKEC